MANRGEQENSESKRAKTRRSPFPYDGMNCRYRRLPAWIEERPRSREDCGDWEKGAGIATHWPSPALLSCRPEGTEKGSESSGGGPRAMAMRRSAVGRNDAVALSD